MKRSSSFSLKSALAAAILLVSSAPAMAAPPTVCPSTQVQQAAQVRRLHSSFMVSALRCDEAQYGLRSRYSAYVNKYNSQITESADVLRSHLSRKGANFDRFITSLSNEVSEDGLSDPSYCVTHQQMFDALLSSSNGTQRLTEYAVAKGVGVPDALGTRGCSSQGVAAKTDAAPKKESVKKDAVKKDTVKKDAVKKDAAPKKEPVKKETEHQDTKKDQKVVAKAH